MARFTLTGKIKSIGPTQTFGSNGFCKRDIVVDEDGTKFPNPVKFTLKKDNCSLADDFKEGDTVTVYASINGREWQNKAKGITQYFVDLDAYKLSSGDESQQQGSGKKGKGVPPPAEPPADFNTVGIEDDQIPF